MSRKKRRKSRRKSRRRVSSKVLAALARGRAKLRKMRGSHKSKRARKRRTVRRAVPKALEPIIITKGDCMSRRRRRRRSRRRFSGVGFEGKKRSRRRGYRYGKRRGRSYRRYYGGEKTSPMNLIIKGAVAVGGGVAASMAAHYVPIKNPKLQAAVPIAIGALLTLLPMTRRNKIAQSAALGAVVVGALSLVRQMFPTVPLLTGDVYEGDQMYVPSYGEQQAMLGYPANMGDYEGEVVAEMGNLDGAEYEGDLDGVELM